MNPLTARAGTTFRVRMGGSVPCGYWEPETVTVEDDDTWDTSWHGGSRRVSRASFPRSPRRVHGIWSGLGDSASGAIGWSGNWIVGVHEYELA